MKTNDYLIEKVKKFKNIGFFEDETEDQILNRISIESKGSYFGDVSDLQNHPYIDAILLSFDRQKVWFTEDWLMFSGSHSSYPDYAELLTTLSLISGNYFQPAQIKMAECGYIDGRDKLLFLSYKQDEQLTELIFCIDGSVLVLSFLEELNEQLGDYTFQYHSDPYGPCFVFFLNQKQKEMLSESLDFQHKSTYWFDKAQYFSENGKINEADTCFQKAIQAEAEDFPAIFSIYAYFMEAQGKKDSAIELLKEGIRQLQTKKHNKKNWWQERMEERLIALS
jgi:tetratricopeptide (TPR) repeat protein